MAYTYGGSIPQDDEEEDIYRGGATGVSSDFNLRDYFAAQAAQAAAKGLDSSQIAAAKADLDPARGAYSYLMMNGLYSPGEQAALESAAVQNINNTTNALQRNINSTITSRGQGANAGAAAALSMPGQFAAAGQRGQVRADLIQKNKEGQLAGLGGFSDLSKAYAGLDTTQLKDADAASGMMDLYNDWRNADVGYDTSDLEKANDKGQKKRAKAGTGYNYGFSESGKKSY